MYWGVVYLTPPKIPSHSIWYNHFNIEDEDKIVCLSFFDIFLIMMPAIFDGEFRVMVV